MRQRFLNFMYGRNGADELSRFVSVASLVVLIVSVFLTGIAQMIVFGVAVAGIIYTYFRMFSKKLAARRRENARYLAQTAKIRGSFSLRREMWKQRKEYRFFKCPSCKAVLRVPKGKGRIRIVCKKCGAAFEKKT